MKLGSRLRYLDVKTRANNIYDFTDIPVQDRDFCILNKMIIIATRWELSPKIQDVLTFLARTTSFLLRSKDEKYKCFLLTKKYWRLMTTL